MRRFPLLILICAVAVFGIAACGGDDEGNGGQADTTPTETTTTETQPAGGGGEAVEVSADPGGALEFEQSSLTAPAGQATFEFTNESSTPHDFAVEQDGEQLGKTEVITSSSDRVELDLQAGEYTFYCSVGGHREAGMEGTLTVE